MRFAGVRIILVLVSVHIEVDDGLPNIAFHAELCFVQVKAAGNPPVCLAIAGCFAPNGDKGGNFDSRKILLCNLCNRGLGRDLGSVVVGDVH